jgi:hypothetical protein
MHSLLTIFQNNKRRKLEWNGNWNAGRYTGKGIVT